MSELREGTGSPLSGAPGDERSPARRIVVGHPVRLVADSLKALFRALAPDLQVTQAISVREVLTALQNGGRYDLLIWSTLQFQNEAIAIIPQFRQIQDDLRILLLVESYDRELIDRAVGMGIRGVITSTTPGEMAIGVARLLLQGGTFIPTGSDSVAAAPDNWGPGILPDISVMPRKSLPNDAMRQYELTPRQWEVLGLLGNGKSNKSIAKDLGMQETTVKAHIKQIMKKLNVENRTQAALFAVRHGAVETRTSAIF